MVGPAPKRRVTRWTNNVPSMLLAPPTPTVTPSQSGLRPSSRNPNSNVQRADEHAEERSQRFPACQGAERRVADDYAQALGDLAPDAAVHVPARPHRLGLSNRQDAQRRDQERRGIEQDGQRCRDDLHQRPGQAGGGDLGDRLDRRQATMPGTPGNVELVVKAEAAALWQGRAEVLAAQPAQAQGRIRALEAPSVMQNAPGSDDCWSMISPSASAWVTGRVDSNNGQIADLVLVVPTPRPRNRHRRAPDAETSSQPMTGPAPETRVVALLALGTAA
jgi:hypothetical protein